MHADGFVDPTVDAPSPSTDEPLPVDASADDQASVDAASADRASVDQASVDRASVDRASVDRASVDRASSPVEVGAVDLDGIERDLAGVEAALVRLDDGTYWTDEVTGDPLPDDLLDRRPTARRRSEP